MVNNDTDVTTPGSIQSPVTSVSGGAFRPSESGEPKLIARGKSEFPNTSNSKLKPKAITNFGTINIQTLCKTGKLKQLTDVLHKRKILIAAVQETRYTDDEAFESEGYRIFKGKPASRNAHGSSVFGTAFLVRCDVVDSIIEFKSTSERLSVLSFRCGNKGYSLVNAHAPTNEDNKKNPENTQIFWQLLEDEIGKIPGHHIKILVGDFNAQLGKERRYRDVVGPYTAHKRTNTNGQRLIDLCKLYQMRIMSTVFPRKPQYQTTWQSPNPVMGSFQIDHVAISARNRKEIMNVRVRKGWNVDSDHFFTQIKTRLLPKRQVPSIAAPPRIDSQFLNDNKERFATGILQREMNDWDQLKSTVCETLNNLGQPRRKRRHRWWNTECDHAVDDRAAAWLKWNSTKQQEDWEDFTKVRQLSSKTIRRVKRCYDRSRLEKLDEEFRQYNTRNFYRAFKEELSGYTPPCLHFKNHEGKLVTSNRGNVQLLGDYFDQLLNCPEPKERLPVVDTIDVNLPSEPPTLLQVTTTINCLKNNKAPGEDGIIAEALKAGGTKIAEVIYRILVDCWETGRIPDDWKTALIHPLHKKGDRSDVNNYRGISLLPIAYKVLSSILQENVERQCGHTIGEYQGGFRRGRSCAEQIFNLKTILQIKSMRSMNITVVFVDFAKAYDSIDRQTIFSVLRERGVDSTTRTLIEQTLTDTFSKVKFRGELSPSFKITTGVRQGDGLSPFLFNLVLDKVIKTWEVTLSNLRIKPVTIGAGTRKIEIRCLAFADDIAILTNNSKDATVAVQSLHEIAAKTGLQISYEKTKFFESRYPGKEPLTTIFGKIGKINRFRYLGEWVHPNGRDGTSIVDRCAKLNAAYKLSQNRYNKKCISKNAKICHYKTVIRPQFLYAAETLLMNRKGTMDDLEKVERRILRKIHGPRVLPDGTYRLKANSVLYHQLETANTSMRRRRLKFYGHLLRMDNNRLTKQIFLLVKSYKTGSLWLNEVKKDLASADISDNDVYDRPKFCHMVNSWSPLPTVVKSRQPLSQERKEKLLAGLKRYWEQKRAPTRTSHQRSLVGLNQ